jgi:ribosomal protein L24
MNFKGKVLEVTQKLLRIIINECMYKCVKQRDKSKTTSDHILES